MTPGKTKERCMRWALAILLCLLAGRVAAQSADTTSGNFMLPHCETSSYDDPYKYHCMGIIAGMSYFGPSLPADMRFCPPEKGTTSQALRVVLKFLHAHPESLHKQFRELAHRAFREAWPCSKPPQ
jgi:hypothetical protein